MMDREWHVTYWLLIPAGALMLIGFLGTSFMILPSQLADVNPSSRILYLSISVLLFGLGGACAYLSNPRLNNSNVISLLGITSFFMPVVGLTMFLIASLNHIPSKFKTMAGIILFALGILGVSGISGVLYYGTNFGDKFLLFIGCVYGVDMSTAIALIGLLMIAIVPETEAAVTPDQVEKSEISSEV